MPNTNTSHLAGEFLVAGELSRRGYPVSITMGNAKSIDIFADALRGAIKVDAKATASKTSWPIEEKSVQNDVQYVFVYLGSKTQIHGNAPPEYFVASGKEILSKGLIEDWKMSGIKYSTLSTSEYKGRWDKLPPPK